ncbi:MAG: Na(+)/H(+) antiporter subunit D [Candidatus Aminicenantes bacterium]|nr:Na(+)/H(+) antiporter subunit D [Candidatus Aminicenantes bacterium]
MTIDFVIPPAAALWAGALVLPLLRRKIRAAALVFFCLAGLALVFLLPDGARLDVRFLDRTLILCRADVLSRLFGIIFAFIAAAGGVYALHLRDTGQQCAALLYAGGSLGAVFAGDLFTFFVCWEVMAAASTFLVWAARNREARRAGFRYLLYHLLGGGVLLLGILLLASQNGGNLEIAAFSPGVSAAAWLILLGVAVNAAVVPLHTWLPDAYPRATVTGAVFLSAFTTKTAVYALARMFPGWEVLLWAGVAMTLYGVVYAVLSDDIRGILAYHIVSQVGFMVAGVGLGTEMGLNGATAHAFSHILYKALLFMAAGLVIHTTGRRNLSALGGLARSQPAVLILYMIAALSISGAPLFNGFISKSMTVSAAGAAGKQAAMLLMLLASVGTFLSVGLKLPHFTWFSGAKGIKPERAPWNMYLAMGLTAAVCVLHGVLPGLLYRWLPYPVDYRPYSAAHLAETVQLLVLTLAAFWLGRRILEPHPGTVLDMDWFFRRPARFLRGLFVETPGKLFDGSGRAAQAAARRLASLSRNPYLLAGRSAAGEAYAQDRHRPAIKTLVSIVLAVFSLLAVLVLIAVR